MNREMALHSSRKTPLGHEYDLPRGVRLRPRAGKIYTSYPERLGRCCSFALAGDFSWELQSGETIEFCRPVSMGEWVGPTSASAPPG